MKIKTNMTIKELIEELKHFPDNTQVFLASDEETNTVFKGFKVVADEMEKLNGVGTFDTCLIYPLTGTEIELW